MLVEAACRSQILRRFRCPEGAVRPCCVGIIYTTLLDVRPLIFLQKMNASHSMSGGDFCLKSEEATIANGEAARWTRQCFREKWYVSSS